jgi:hypothetical protein
MKRYRWTTFFVDTERNIVLNLPGAIDPQTVSGAVGSVAHRHGLLNIQDKYTRWLNLSPSALCVPVEWHELLREVESAYVHGDYFPALTSACCLGERILNHLIIGLRDYSKSSPHYKKVAQKDSFQDWKKLISILKEWRILDDDLSNHFKRLLDLRNPAVHFGGLQDKMQNANTAVQEVYYVTSKMFGEASSHFFVCDGEFYVKKDKISSPIVKEFIIPHCCLLSYKHNVESRDGVPTIVDDLSCQDVELSDEEFIEFRRTWRNDVDKGEEFMDK